MIKRVSSSSYRRIPLLLFLLSIPTTLTFFYAQQTHDIHQDVNTLRGYGKHYIDNVRSVIGDSIGGVREDTTDLFLAAYDAYLELYGINGNAKEGSEGKKVEIDGKLERGREFCTPDIEKGQVEVEMDGGRAGDVHSLSAEDPHYLNIRTFCDARFPGVTDYYETLIEHPQYRTRIKLSTPFDGSGVFKGDAWRLPSELVGKEIRLRVWRLYREFEGIRINKELHGDYTEAGTPYAREELVDIKIKVVELGKVSSGHKKRRGLHHRNGGLLGWVEGLAGGSEEDRTRLCTYDDFHRTDWRGGFWYREEMTDESWHFHLPHCRTRKFSQDEASECLDGRWIGFLGDSTTQDMYRNTFWSVLGDAYPYPNDKPLAKAIQRLLDHNITHPTHPERWTRMSTIFNGHHELRANREGMNSFRHPMQIERHDEYFAKSKGMDAIIVNTGLHDAWLRPTLQSMMSDFDYGWKYYVKNWLGLGPENAVPEIIYRFTVAPALHLDKYRMVTPMNPHSIEVINMLQKDYLVQRQKEEAFDLTYLDSYEITYAWHFDGEMNQGPHYGRPPWDSPGIKKVPDDMMVHIFLNRLCPQIANRNQLNDPAGKMEMMEDF